MAYEHRENSGSLFKNDKRHTESHPNYKGSANIGGKEYWVSCWRNESKGGEVFLSLAFSEKHERADKHERSSSDEKPEGGFDDIPF